MNPGEAVEQTGTAAAPDDIWRAYRKVLHLQRAVPEIRPLPRTEGAFPLSPVQQRLWILHQLDPSSPHYNVARAFEIEGPLDVPALERSLEEIVRRHEALRTGFYLTPEGPVQIPEAGLLPRLVQIDLSGLAAEDAGAALPAALRALGRQAFDLTRPPLFRPALARLAPGRHVLLLALHHIVFDGASLRIFWRELASLYPAFAAGRAPALPALPVQYVDFARWQRDFLSGEVLAEQLETWKRQLAGAPPVLDLAADRPRPPAESHRGATLAFSLPGPLAEELKALGRREGATFFMVLLAGLALLVYRTTGQTDLPIGTPTANRSRREIRGLIGFFVNTLVLRVRLDAGLAAAGLLREVREAVTTAFSAPDLPLDRLVDELGIERSPGYNPLFQVMFVLQSAALAGVGLPGLRVSPRLFDSEAAMFDLSLEMEEGEDGVDALLEYATDLFDPPTVRRLAAHLEILLAGAVADPERPLDDLPLLTPAERQAVLIEWSGAGPGAPEDPSPVHELFFAQALRSPDAVAVRGVAGDELTYAELARRAGLLAARLVRAGVGPEVPVGVRVQRSPELITALLAVLAAGGAYVPVDPSYPRERRSLVLRRAGVSLVIADEDAAGEIAGLGLQVLAPDPRGREAGVPPGSGERRSPAVTGPGGLAYVLFTSGSTGRPKGVEISHRSLAAYTLQAVRQFGLRPGDRVLQFASIGFDTAAEEIFPCLAAGATLVLRDDAMIDSVPVFLESCKSLGITVLDLPTAYWHEWVAWRAGRPMALWPELRLVILGGESLLPGRLAEWRRQVGSGVRLLNTYGPTEATIVSTLQDLTGSVAGRTVSIGRPLPAVRAWVLDASLRPLPPGSPGELCLGGIGLARGYAGDGAATAAQFAPDPCSGETGARLYRTGDRVRHLPDGSLEFLGRIDGQVKIRGIRIELGEVEAVLTACPAIAGGAVALDAGGTGLTAFVVAAPGHPADPAPLRAFLAERLPAAWLPGAFVFVPALPLSPHGKVDRRALAKLAADSGPRPAPSTAPPRTPLERVLTGIWEEVTGREGIGVEDNFFAIGGHSLLGSQILSRLYDGFHVRFPLRGLFDAPTVAGLAEALRRDFDPRHSLEAHCRLLLLVRELPDAEVAAWLARRSPAPGGASETAGPPSLGLDPERSSLLGLLLAEEGIAHAALPSIPRGPRRPGEPRALSFSQERLWFFEQLEPGSLAYILSAGFALRGPLDGGALARSLGSIVERHDVLRAAFPNDRGRPVQKISPAALPVLARADLGSLPEGLRETGARRLAASLAREPFDIARGPLFRFCLLRLGDGLHWLALAVHHIAFDGWSLDIFLRELSEGYAAAVSGRSPRLPELPVQYPDFALWQRGWLDGPEARGQLDYWRARLAGSSGCTLPPDRPRPAVQTTRGASASLAIPPEVAGALRSLGRREGTSLFMTLLAIFAVLLGRHAGQEDVVVGTPVAGRNGVDIERLIGLFLNTLTLRLDLSGRPSFSTLLGRVREAVLGGMAHQDLPFEELVKELKPERDLARTPLFQVLFNMLSLQGRPLALPGVEAESLPPLSEEAKFDLTLYAEEPATGEISLLLVYNADLYDAPRMADFLAQFGQLAAAVAELPGRPADQLSLRTPAAAALLPDPARPLPAVPWEGGIPRRFASWARRAPGRTAVVDGAGSLDYGTLDAWSRRLARQLRAGGVGPEEIVAVYAHRSASLVAALLGILRAGAAFLILDPAYPPALLVQRLRLGRPKAWIECAGTDVSAEVAACLAEDGGPALRLRLSGPGAEEDAADGLDDPGFEIRPDGLAYLAFTSGTTGLPKGILGTHRPLDAFLGWHARTFGLGETDRFSALSGLSHDPLLRDLFAPLAVGGSVHLPDPGQMGLPGWLAAWMEESAITVSHLTPAMAEVLLESAPPGASLPELRYLFFGGDLLDRQIVERMRGLAPRARVVNFYGATETPQGIAFHVVEDGVPAGIVPVGRGIDGAQLLVLGPGGIPAGIGELGEISVRGACLARGYLDDRDGDRFRVNPWTGDPGDRLYRTGDLGRYLPDGTVAHLGRSDAQVKIRGYRIELLAIEAALESHPEVARAAVVPRPDRRGGRELIAFVVPRAAEPEGGALRRHLATRLAPYALPAAYAVLPTLPLTPNGKIDRSALASLARAVQPPCRTEESAPMDALGRRLARIWQLLLGGPVGLEDNFFDLGGHSLLAVRLLAEIEQEFEVKLPVTSLFQAQTIQDLALTLREALAEAGKDTSTAKGDTP
jgi:amino acid adenylation domain-containing protein